MSDFDKYFPNQSINYTGTTTQSETLPTSGVFTEQYNKDNAFNNSQSREVLIKQVSDLREYYHHLQKWYNYTLYHNNELKKTIESRDAEIQYLYDKVTRKNTEQNIEDEKNTDKWWNTINLDKVELDAQIQLNNQYAVTIDKLKKRLNRNRRYSRKLLKKNKLLIQSNHIDHEISTNNTSQSNESCIKQIFYKENEYVFRNICMTAVYGRVPSIALWNSEDNNFFSLEYWSVWGEEEACKIIEILKKDYLEFPTLKIFIEEHISECKKNTIKNYNCLVLKKVANWLFYS